MKSFCSCGSKLPFLLLAAVAAMLHVSSGSAQERLTTLSMNCVTVRNLVRSEGSVVLYTGPHLYDRYVDHAGFCPIMMRTQAAWVPTRDNGQCFIGYTCEQPNFRSRR